MTDRKAPTVNLQGGSEYAKVPERLKLYRQDCPNGKTVTKNEVNEKGETVFTAYIWKDKAEVKYDTTGQVVLDSADANGTAKSVTKGEKDFEKLETIAIGRALALLGYLASGEIASSEEMEEFNRYREEKKQQAIAEAIQTFRNATTLDELKEAFKNCGILRGNSQVIEAKDARKAEISQELPNAEA